jgi:hypothetical protein
MPANAGRHANHLVIPAKAGIHANHFVIPAKAGIQCWQAMVVAEWLGPGFPPSREWRRGRVTGLSPAVPGAVRSARAPGPGPCRQ